MVTQWGYSDKLGTVAYGDNQEEVFLGHSVARTQNVSEETAQADRRARSSAWSRTACDEARQILTEQARRPAHAGQGAARVRDPQRRRDHQRAEGRAAGPRRSRQQAAEHAHGGGADLAAAERRTGVSPGKGTKSEGRPLRSGRPFPFGPSSRFPRPLRPGRSGRCWSAPSSRPNGLLPAPPKGCWPGRSCPRGRHIRRPAR